LRFIGKFKVAAKMEHLFMHVNLVTVW